MNFGRAYSYAEGDGGNRSHAIYTARPTCWLSELCGSKAVESLPLCAEHRGGDISSRSPLPGGSLGYMVSLTARTVIRICLCIPRSKRGLCCVSLYHRETSFASRSKRAGQRGQAFSCLLQNDLNYTSSAQQRYGFDALFSHQNFTSDTRTM